MDVSKENVESVLSTDKLVVLDFWASWCGPCKMLLPIVNELIVERPEVVIGKINVDENVELAKEFGIRNLPTVLFLKDGKVIDRFSGGVGKPEFTELINKNL